jgi:hypothetical protein
MERPTYLTSIQHTRTHSEAQAAGCCQMEKIEKANATEKSANQ